MNLIILNDTEHMRDILMCLAHVSDQTVVYAQTDKKSVVELSSVPSFPLSSVELPVKIQHELPPINTKRIQRETGTSKEHFSHRSKFHSKHIGR